MCCCYWIENNSCSSHFNPKWLEVHESCCGGKGVHFASRLIWLSVAMLSICTHINIICSSTMESAHTRKWHEYRAQFSQVPIFIMKMNFPTILHTMRRRRISLCARSIQLKEFSFVLISHAFLLPSSTIERSWFGILTLDSHDTCDKHCCRILRVVIVTISQIIRLHSQRQHEMTNKNNKQHVFLLLWFFPKNVQCSDTQKSVFLWAEKCTKTMACSFVRRKIFCSN